MGGPYEGAPQRFVGKPLRELACAKSLDEVLLDREMEPKGLAFD